MGHTYISLFITKRSQDRNSDRDLKAEADSKAIIGVLFTGLLIKAYSMFTIETDNQLPILL